MAFGYTFFPPTAQGPNPVLEQFCRNVGMDENGNRFAASGGTGELLVDRMFRAAQQAFGDPRGPLLLDADERGDGLAAVAMGWVEQDGNSFRLTAKGVEAVRAGQSAPASSLPPASADLLRQMANMSLSNSGNVFGSLQLDPHEHADVVPLVNAGLVIRNGDSVRISEAGAKYLRQIEARTTA
jgi:hypothetical protein